jgi:PAS domain S-box-containing protein
VLEIRSAARRLAGGDYETPVVRHSGDEIGDLAESVDYLRQRLKVTTISRNYLDSVLNSMPDAVLVTTPEGIIRRTNDATEKLLGWAEFELVGRELRSIIGETDRATFNLATVHEIGETIVETHGGQSIPVSISGSTLSGDDVQFRGYVFVLRNITERKRAERRIRYLARYDTLTKIPNRMQFQHLLQQALARNLRQGRAVAQRDQLEVIALWLKALQALPCQRGAQIGQKHGCCAHGIDPRLGARRMGQVGAIACGKDQRVRGAQLRIDRDKTTGQRQPRRLHPILWPSPRHCQGEIRCKAAPV